MSRIAHDRPASTLSFSSASSLRSFISGSSQSTLRASLHRPLMRSNDLWFTSSGTSRSALDRRSF